MAVAAIEAGADPAKTVNHAINNLSVEDGAADLDPGHLADLVAMEIGGDLSSTQAKTVLGQMVVSSRPPAEIAAELGFEAMDTSELDALIDGLIEANPSEWDRFVNGDDKDRGKMQGFFTGQIMKATRGQADGKVVNQLLSARRP